ncbi:MAG TPA: ATP-dependent zinc metalloprotease FtsH [Spirochaetia bacterium]|nr:ATP-dependent zinc metalloprotease FtsH [Spirochaetaceae bacterium]HPE88643.1 ATP-dependent zinc metalloprotease FtsH [Spirochaetales bacterium]HRW23482.1 ATP-dependent zinc metalloprotease FtsH [Spirochaetia bacterium]
MPRKNDSWNSKKPKKPLKGPPIPPINGWKYTIAYVFIAIISITLFNWFVESADSSIVPYSEFKSLVASGRIERIEMDSNYYTGYGPKSDRQDGRPSGDADARVFKTVPIYDADFTKLLDEKGVTYSAVSREGNAMLGFVLNWVLPIGLMFFLWRMLQRRLTGMGSNVLSVGQNKAVIVAEGDVKTRFVDVAGVDEAKEELVEVVDFLKNPKKYTDIGGKIPKGVLLVGPPGTGKTLLARAVAGEAGVPFFRMSGAEFVEMFVGVGAARVRDLFKQAREKAPCIVFIDELDAIGKSRVNGVMGGNDEREQTLNQLLVEMDGFDATSGLIILAATNRPDVLDPALLRPGRFDRQVGVDRPDIVGREAILDIHSKAVKLDPAADLKKVARATPGFVGADLANVVNEAALLAVRAGRKKVHQADFEKAVEKIMTGLEKKSRVMNPDERRVIAYHEAGHAIVAAFTPEADPVQKVSIVPRGFGALGFTLQVPIEDRYIVTEDKLLGEIDVLMGGRAAEELTFGKVSTGAANDITRATDIARRMITDYGMSERYRNVALTKRGAGMMGPSAEPVMAREYGEETQRYIDETVAATVAARYDIARRRLEERRALLDELAGELLEKESIDEAAFKAIVAPPAASEERLASS